MPKTHTKLDGQPYSPSTNTEAVPGGEEGSINDNLEQNSASAKQASDTAKPDPHHIRAVGAEQHLLEVFVGRWQVKGENKAIAPGGSNEAVIGEESYEWMPGKFFLLTKWHRKFESSEHIGTGFVGYDPDIASYVTHRADNLGYARIYNVTNTDRTWIYSGNIERAARVFSDDGNSYTENWELSKDGKNWQPLCELEGTRIR